MGNHHWQRLGVAFSILLGACSAARADLVFEATKIENRPLPSASEVLAAFSFRNTGSKPVTITRMEPDCTCTTAMVVDRTIPAGASGQVLVRFEVGSRHGPYKSIIFLQTNESGDNSQMLVLNTELPEMITPAEKLLSWPAGAARDEKQLKVKVTQEPTVTELRATSPNGAVQIKVERTGPAEYLVKVTPRPGVPGFSTPLYLDAVLSAGPTKRSSVVLHVE